MVNNDNLQHFNQPDQADKWVWRIENVVGIWVNRHIKSFWYLVRWESIRNGTLKEDISRRDFAKLLIQECSEALEDRDTESSILHNMEKFKFKSDLKTFGNLKENHPVRKFVNELSGLLTSDVPADPAPKDFNLERRMHEYLTTTTANEQFTKVCYHPQYNGKTATFSVENYMSQRFMDANQPSWRIIFECSEEKVTEEKVEMYYGRFCSLKNTKLFIASTQPFSGGVKKEAENREIGLVLVNTNSKVNETNFVLPRTQVGQLPDHVLWHQMLVGMRKLTVPILAYDGLRIDDSLSFILYKYASCDKQNLFVGVPLLSDGAIEAEAYRLVRSQVDSFVSLLRRCSIHDKVPACEIDPYLLAYNMGLKVTRGKTGKKLGQIDIAHKNVTLSSNQKTDSATDRFSMAHEIGHHLFHGQVSEKAQDGVHTIVSGNKRHMEHHANHFASCLLMPAPVLRLLYDIYWKKEFKSEEVAPLRLNEVNYFLNPFYQRIVCPVARKMNVSPQAAYIRLKNLGLVID